MFVALFHSAELFLHFERFLREGAGPSRIECRFFRARIRENPHLVFAAFAKQSFLHFALPPPHPSLSIPLSLKWARLVEIGTRS